MPEGDSVWRAARRLDRALAGQVVVRSDFRVPQHATADLSGRTVLPTDTHGKHLLTRFDDGATLHTHFEMDGSWTVVGAGKRLPRRFDPEVRVLLEVRTGQVGYGLSIPVVELVRTRDEHLVVGHLGPDPLREDWDAGEAACRLGVDAGRPVAAALLDQRLMAGLGNLWVNEICFLRGMSPWTPVADVDLDRTVALARRCLRHSIMARGNGQVTTGSPKPGEEHWVYGRTGLGCRRCGTLVRHARELPGDPQRRATWWCPRCQPGPGPDRLEYS
ncbi:MAG: Fpg/Nei family DNA glycosylase [Actinomycetota bacterium]|nr:Fpg/Nei family DNA glycosylase [Actinomycetota bacterium]